MVHAHERRRVHSHGLGSGYSHAPASFDKAFALGAALNIAIVLAELVFGYLANSAWWVDPLAFLGIVWFVIREGREAWQGEECCNHCRS